MAYGLDAFHYQCLTICGIGCAPPDSGALDVNTTSIRYIPREIERGFTHRGKKMSMNQDKLLKDAINDGAVKLGWGLIDYIQAPPDNKTRTFEVFKDKDGSYEVILRYHGDIILVERGEPAK